MPCMVQGFSYGRGIGDPSFLSVFVTIHGLRGCVATFFYYKPGLWILQALSNA